MGEVRELFKVNEVELIYRNKGKVRDRPKITSTRFAFQIFLGAWNTNKLELVEQSMILLVDQSNGCIGASLVSTGSTCATLIDSKIIYSTALKANASGIILAHNHPSGSVLPSDADVALTMKLREAGKVLDVQLLDHLIIQQKSYFSFAEHGLVLGR